jgi:hypothetical protein
VEGGGDVDQHLQRLVAVVRDRGRRQHRRLTDQVAAGHVAEVDQPVRHQPAAGVSTADQVVVGHVAVDHLPPQPPGEPRDGVVVHRHRAIHEGAPGGIADVAQQAVNHRPGMAHVPLQDAVGGGVIELGEGHRNARGDASHSGAHAAGKMPRLCQRQALDVADQPHVVGLATTVDGHDQAAVKRRKRARRLERQAGRGRMRHAGILHLERAEPEVRVGDLQHRAAAVRRGDAEVAVLVAAQLERLARHPEQLSRQLPRVIRAERRGEDLVAVEQAVAQPDSLRKPRSSSFAPSSNSSPWAPSTTAIRVWPLRRAAAARQSPASVVLPVLTPIASGYVHSSWFRLTKVPPSLRR